MVADQKVRHREDEYDSQAFDVLREMQERHFWYRGRHRFLLDAVRRAAAKAWLPTPRPRVVDLGGGCGGWVKYLAERSPMPFAELALADSSLKALEYAATVVPGDVTRHQIDLLQLGWHERWDIAFLLDVLEHIPDEQAALTQIREALAPGGLLFITTPALQCFWSWNDDLAHHQRRYSKADFRRLATTCGFEVLSTRYFMFFLSPLLLATRWGRRPDLVNMTNEDRQTLLAKTHRVPSRAVNQTLYGVFSCETPLGHWTPFPWGTSILAVLRRPVCRT